MTAGKWQVDGGLIKQKSLHVLQITLSIALSDIVNKVAETGVGGMTGRNPRMTRAVKRATVLKVVTQRLQSLSKLRN